MRIILFQTKKGGRVAKYYKSDASALKSIKALSGKLKPLTSISPNISKQLMRRSQNASYKKW